MSTGQAVDAYKPWAWMAALLTPTTTDVSALTMSSQEDARCEDAQPAIATSCNRCNAAVLRNSHVFKLLKMDFSSTILQLSSVYSVALMTLHQLLA